VKYVLQYQMYTLQAFLYTLLHKYIAEIEFSD